MDKPFLRSETVMSLAFPVREPSGSPLARASADGTGIPVKSVSTMGFATGAGGALAAGAAWLLAGAEACAQPIGAQLTTAIASARRLFLIGFILASPLFPNCFVDIGPVEQTDNAEQADCQPEKHDHQAPAHRGRQRQAEQANYKSEE